MKITPEQAEKLYLVGMKLVHSWESFRSVNYSELSPLLAEIEKANEVQHRWVCDFCNLVLNEDPKSLPPAFNSYCSRAAAAYELGRGKGSFHQFTHFAEKK